MTTSLFVDIGGTNVRFAQMDSTGVIHDYISAPCANFPHVNDAIAFYYDTVKPKQKPTKVGMSVAGPPNDVYIELVNQSWKFYVRDVQEKFSFEDIKIINDFTAIALAIPLLQESEKEAIGGGQPQEGKPIAVLGPGTGLGVSILVPAHDPAFIILTNNEGGHFTIPAMTDRESDVLTVLRRHFNHVSAERVLSGPGIANIYQALCEIDGAPKLHLEPAAIAEQGLTNTCPLCHEALDMFCAFLGTAASNVCITTAAYGGVYLAGGILPKLGSFFHESKFRKRFETKGRFSNYLEAAPTYLIKHDMPFMLGLKNLVTNL
jgi:glucokinase